ncbi:helix-turn-helix domain-containing protein [Flavobacterium hungaricum]|uniref:XRE family transcriptional regulator n=1 Tax=Flavobacterium hungaricum TaxID=2082725 RepID=A0ABR9THK9_9FLAO|nr:helix-turn-helix transcriptional regulator [Flavobacterium hungaricum]MBE8724750.1 XRE family transcriptional regulator [Flavobacterium hungaricum]
MVNIDDFVKRLENILEYYALNASTFADKIGVQRSSMSHLLSGRNKPSLDFVMKIIEVFPEVDIYWLLNGTGNFPKNNEVPTEVKKSPAPISYEISNSPDLFSTFEKTEKMESAPKDIAPQKINLAADQEEIEKIVFFYKNGTFKVYNS